MAKNILLEVSKEEEARAYYESELIFELDQRGRMNQALRQGKEEGRLEGRIEGKFEANIETAKEMLKDGIDIETIAKYTKLSAEEIRNNFKV